MQGPTMEVKVEQVTVVTNLYTIQLTESDLIAAEAKPHEFVNKLRTHCKVASAVARDTSAVKG